MRAGIGITKEGIITETLAASERIRRKPGESPEEIRIAKQAAELEAKQKLIQSKKQKAKTNSLQETKDLLKQAQSMVQQANKLSRSFTDIDVSKLTEAAIIAKMPTMNQAATKMKFPSTTADHSSLQNSASWYTGASSFGVPTHIGLSNTGTHLDTIGFDNLSKSLTFLDKTRDIAADAALSALRHKEAKVAEELRQDAEAFNNNEALRMTAIRKEKQKQDNDHIVVMKNDHAYRMKKLDVQVALNHFSCSSFQATQHSFQNLDNESD
jgi:hypothetical protein